MTPRKAFENGNARAGVILEMSRALRRIIGFVGVVACVCAPALGQTLHRGNGAEPGTLDPAKSETLGEGHIQGDLFEGLVILDRDGGVQPGQAAYWTVSPDGLHYRFTLRAGLRWSNGDPLTAMDFVYSLRRVVDPKVGSSYAYLLAPIANADAIIDGTIKDPAALGVSAPDPRTLDVTLAAPTPFFLTLLAHSKFLPVHRESVERWGQSFTRPGHLVSNGAFMLKDWVPQARIVLERNPYYRDAGHVALKRVVYLPIEDGGTELRMYRAGQVDITADVPAALLDVVRRDFPQELATAPALSASYLGYNLTRPPFRAAGGLRLALALVIDREAICDRILKSSARPAYGWVPPGLPGYSRQRVSWADWPMARRITLARQLYAAAGYGPSHRLRLELRFNTNDTNKRLAIAIASMWHETLGVETDLLNEEFKVFLENRKARKVTQVYRGGWTADYADPSTFTDLLGSKAGLNDTGYDNPDYDALIARAAADADPVGRMADLAAAERLLLSDLPLIPLYDGMWLHLVKGYVQGYRPNVLGYAYSKDIRLRPDRAP